MRNITHKGVFERQYFTEKTARHWDFVVQENLTAKEAVEFLKSGIMVRTFQENLQAFYSGSDLEERLTEGLYRYYGECSSLYTDGIKDQGCYTDTAGVKQQSIRRKVRNWMQNKNLPTDREELFCICFILQLDDEVSDYLLKRLTGQGIHYRNTRELLYAYCLKYHYEYEYALELAGQLCMEDAPGQTNIDSVEQQMLTGKVKSMFQAICDEEKLIEFMLDCKSSFGQYHNTAYQYFDKMLKLLTEADGEACSLEKIVDTYLRLNMPKNRNTRAYDDIQKLVKKYWPGSRSIKAMKNRSQDVTRKVLLILYLVTGGVSQEQYLELDEEYVTPEEFLECHCRAMNQMLNECGMARLDPRNAFDYLVLYSIRPEGETFMSDRMAEIVSELYAGNE